MQFKNLIIEEILIINRSLKKKKLITKIFRKHDSEKLLLYSYVY